MLCFSGDGNGSVYEDMIYSQQLCFFFFCFSFFFLFFYFFIFLFFYFFIFFKVQIQREVGNREKRFDHSSQNREVRPRFAQVPVFFHGAVLEAKRTAKMSGSRFFWWDRTVRSGFQNHAHVSFSSLAYKTLIPLFFSSFFSSFHCCLSPFVLLYFFY